MSQELLYGWPTLYTSTKQDTCKIKITNLKGFQHHPFSKSSEPNPYFAEAAKDTRQKIRFNQIILSMSL